MLNLLVNFCIITFIYFAVSDPAKAILFPKKRGGAKRTRTVRRSYVERRVQPARRGQNAEIISLEASRAARGDMRAA